MNTHIHDNGCTYNESTVIKKLCCSVSSDTSDVKKENFLLHVHLPTDLNVVQHLFITTHTHTQCSKQFLTPLIFSICNDFKQHGIPQKKNTHTYTHTHNAILYYHHVTKFYWQQILVLA